VDANLDLVAAAYDGVVDVTAAVTAVTAAAPRDVVLLEVS
jgi:hypothetical protein